MTTPRRPARPGITLEGALKPRHLAGYLTGAVGTAAMLAAPQAEAAVAAVTFGFGTSYNSSDTNGPVLWPVNGGTFGTLRGFVDRYSLGIGGGAGGGVYHNGSGAAPFGLMSFFAASTGIGTGANGPNFGSAYAQSAYFPGIDFTSDQLNKNIGFKTSSNNWGWANVSWTEADKTLTFHSAFVESVAGASITVGAIPEPSGALLALAGLGGAALRRRRKVAA